MLNERIKNPFDSTQTVTLYYATDRKVADTAPQCLDPFFSLDSAPGLSYGTCRISVPVKREVGALDLATESGSNVHTTFRSLEHNPLSPESFSDALQNGPEDVMIFVHGFNVRFEEAAFRASQILFDTKFQGAAVLYSWPAGAPESMLSSAYLSRTYSDNKKNAAASVTHFKEFMDRIVSLKKRIFLVVHSMGHQVVLPALSTLATPAGEGNPQVPFVQELVLNAPDFPTKDLEALSGKLSSISKRTTLYCSPLDNALMASARLNKNDRAGTCRAFAGVDVINVSNVDTPALGIGGLGHGYYSGRPVLGDLSQVFLGIQVEKRLFIQRSFEKNREGFALRK